MTYYFVYSHTLCVQDVRKSSFSPWDVRVTRTDLRPPTSGSEGTGDRKRKDSEGTPVHRRRSVPTSPTSSTKRRRDPEYPQRQEKEVEVGDHRRTDNGKEREKVEKRERANDKVNMPLI